MMGFRGAGITEQEAKSLATDFPRTSKALEGLGEYMAEVCNQATALRGELQRAETELQTLIEESIHA